MLKSEHEQIAKNHGFDNYFIFNDAGFKTVARLKGEKSGIVIVPGTAFDKNAKRYCRLSVVAST